MFSKVFCFLNLQIGAKETSPKLIFRQLYSDLKRSGTGTLQRKQSWLFRIQNRQFFRKVQEGNDQEKAQSEKDSLSKLEVGKN